MFWGFFLSSAEEVMRESRSGTEEERRRNNLWPLFL